MKHQQPAEIDSKIEKSRGGGGNNQYKNNLFSKSSRSLETNEELLNSIGCQTELDTDQLVVFER